MTEQSERVTEVELLERIGSLSGGRRIVALAGAPGSGKSTLAETLVDKLNARRPGRAATLPMDGYHFDDRVLNERGHLSRKGAPHTFDVGGLRAMLSRLRDSTEGDIAIPIFDRSIEIARAGAATIPASVEIVVVEGNWLLLDQAPWTALEAAFDLSVLIDVPEDVLRNRLAQRWVGYGLNPEQIEAKLEDNDLPNGRIVRTESRRPDLVLEQP